MAHYLRARELNPNDAELLAEMANFLIFIGQPKRAIDQVKEAIRLNPFHEGWYVEYLGWAYEEAGMPKEAVEIFEQAVDLRNPRDDQLWYFPTLAVAYTQLGRTDDARKIVEISPVTEAKLLDFRNCIAGISLQDKGTQRQICQCGATGRTAGVSLHS